MASAVGASVVGASVVVSEHQPLEPQPLGPQSLPDLLAILFCRFCRVLCIFYAEQPTKGVNAIKSACGLLVPLDFDPVGLWAAGTVSLQAPSTARVVLIELTTIYTLERLPKFVTLERGCWKYLTFQVCLK